MVKIKAVLLIHSGPNRRVEQSSVNLLSRALIYPLLFLLHSILSL